MLTTRVTPVLVYFLGVILSVRTCSESELAIYRLTFETYWTRHRFPKQYPEYRPPAQWSRLVGTTHDETYTLFRIGELATKGFRIFAETGRTEFVQLQGNATFDEFYSPAIRTGAGRTDVDFVADGNRSRVSFAVRIVPSPDWFVGVDSLVLCDRGKWIDSHTFEAHPIDAGTDSGFTFTAPNWASDPQERISRITSTHPKHPANSFFYPMLSDLPAIAKFRIKKKKLYKLVKSHEGSPPEKSLNEVAPPGKMYKYKKSHKLKKLRKPRFHAPCQMKEWSEWSPCNTTCGKGHAKRIRVTLTPMRCSNATEEKKCNDFTGCYSKYFSW